MERNFQTFLEGLVDSENSGYLRQGWQSLVSADNYICKTDSDMYALLMDCIETCGGECWHGEQDEDEYRWDEINEEYINSHDAITVNTYRNHRRAQLTTHRRNDDIVWFDHEYYDQDYLWDYGIVTMYNGELEWHDNAYHWERDDEYHWDPEPEDDDDEDEDDYSSRSRSERLWGYDSGPRELSFVNDDKVGEGVQFGFGVEIEKSEMPDFEFDKCDLYEKTGAVMERDGSVPNGFELKTPIYNLMSAKTDERIQALKPFCDIKGVENAGGHVGFSMSGKRDEELLDLCSGWLPLIFAMYKKRLNNSYCQGKNIDGLKRSGEKMQAVRMRGSYIEFRLCSSVKSFQTLKFRLAFFRIMAQNLGKSFNYVMTMAISEGTELNKLLRGDIYEDADKFCRLMSNAITMNKQFIGKRITNKSLDKIQNQLTTIKSN